MELHRKKRGPPGKLERLDLKAASRIPEDFWPTPLNAISEGQSAAGSRATHTSVLPATSCPSVHNNAGNKTMFQIKPTWKSLSATGIMNHLLAPQATQGMLKKNLPLAQGFVTYSYVPQGAKFFYY